MTNRPLELIQTNIFGPISSITNGGNKYFLLLVNDFSRYIKIEFLRNKNEVFAAFKKVKIKTKVQSKRIIRILRIDRGGEFLSNEFKNFCKSQDIRQQFLALYSPQQNGIVEERNQTVVEITRSLFK